MLGRLKVRRSTFEVSSLTTTRYTMKDDKLGCDSDYDEVLDEVWKDIQKNGLSGNSPTPEEWELWAAESAAPDKPRAAQKKETKSDDTEGSEPQ